MKVILNDYPEPMNTDRQELPATTLVEFHNDAGTKFAMRLTEDGSLEVRCIRQQGWDQMVIEPKFFNQIIIK